MTKALLGLFVFLGSVSQLWAQETAPAAVTSPAASAPNPALIGDLIKACEQGNLDQVKVLVDRGAPIDAVYGKYQWTPLMVASVKNPDVVKYLIGKGAKLDAGDSEGNTALTRACFMGADDCVAALLEAGADPNLPNQGGRYPLMNAIKKGDDVIVSALIAHHADVNARGKNGSAALWFAIDLDRLSSLKLLIDAGVDLNPKPIGPVNPEKPRVTPLAGAAVKKDPAMMDLLLAHGADINGTSEGGVTPLIEAVTSSDAAAVGYLLGKGADPNLQNDQGETALMLATLYQKPPVLQDLLDHKAALELKDKRGRTALSWACLYVFDPAIRLLVERGADVNTTDLQGETPTSYAGDRGDEAIVQLLREKGAHPQESHIIAKEKPAPPLSAEQTWALAVSAIYSQLNGDNPLILGGGDEAARSARMLREDWKITDKKSLLAELNELRDKGHRDGYQTAGAVLAAMTDADFAAKSVILTPHDQRQAKLMRASYLKWKERSALAWDLCRAANLVNAGFAANYLDDQEAWHLLLPIVRQVQGHFGSWQEMNDNFLDGREIWAIERDAEFEACAQLLLNPKDPNSPWNQNPWKTDLSVAPQ